jgi:hypothetical protein
MLPNFLENRLIPCRFRCVGGVGGVHPGSVLLALRLLGPKVQRFNGPRRLGSNLLRTKEPKDRVRVANYTVDGGRRISTITFGQPRCRTALKGMRALGLSVDVEAKQHDIPGLVETITKYLAERPTLEKYQPLSSKEHSYGNDENPSH